MLCPVRVVRTYVGSPQDIRRNNQLFVYWAGPHKSRPVTKQRLSYFLVEAITMTSSNEILQSPEGLCAHSTRSLATSWALFWAVDLQEICAAARWSSPLTFI